MSGNCWLNTAELYQQLLKKLPDLRVLYFSMGDQPGLFILNADTDADPLEETDLRVHVEEFLKLKMKLGVAK